jgi:hypothetical protein
MLSGKKFKLTNLFGGGGKQQCDDESRQGFDTFESEQFVLSTNSAHSASETMKAPQVSVDAVVQNAISSAKHPSKAVWLAGIPAHTKVAVCATALRLAVNEMISHVASAGGERDDVIIEVVECTETVSVIVSTAGVDDAAFAGNSHLYETISSLNLSYRIATDFGGNVDVESKLNNLSVALTLPLPNATGEALPVS